MYNKINLLDHLYFILIYQVRNFLVIHLINPYPIYFIKFLSL